MNRVHLPIILAGVGIVLMVLALAINHQKSSTEPPAPVFSRKIVKINIEGAVMQPGVYEIPNDSRIQDVLITAGGLGAKADRRYLSEHINLSQLVFDGQKLYIPEDGEKICVVNINTASDSELDALPGVGEATIKKITTNRPYQNTSELVEKKVVGKATYEKIKDQLCVTSY